MRSSEQERQRHKERRHPKTKTKAACSGLHIVKAFLGKQRVRKVFGPFWERGLAPGSSTSAGEEGAIFRNVNDNAKFSEDVWWKCQVPECLKDLQVSKHGRGPWQNPWSEQHGYQATSRSSRLGSRGTKLTV